jgi:hypothetical protein
LDLGRKDLFIDKEIWKQKIIEGRNYYISNYGNVKTDRGLIKPYSDRDGYLRFGVNGKTFGVHRLVAELFISDEDLSLEVNHKDFDRSNNYVENLEWVTHTENVRYSCLHKRRPDTRGSKNSNSILTEENVLRIRELLKDGMTVADIARLYGRGWQTINHIKQNNTWQSV